MHPSAGGPPVVVDRWCAHLRASGIDALVLTTDAYSEAGEDHAWIERYREKFPIEVVPCVGPRGFGYGRGLKQQFAHQLRQADLVHVHNLWGYTNLIAAKQCAGAGVPFVVSTHGMLDPHSVARKRWKKRLYGRWIQWPALRRAAGLMFTHAEEERLARASVARLPPGYVVPLGADPPPSGDRESLWADFEARYPNLRGLRRIVFLGRLHSKKGLDLLLPAFARLRQSHRDVHLVLAGPGEPDYVAQLRRTLGSLHITDATTLTGPLHGHDKWSALAAADVFVLPSYQENFALSVIESLGVRTPVVLSDRVNIWQDLVSAGVAMRCELCADDLCRVMAQMLSEPDEARAMGERGQRLASERYSWQRSTELLVDAYRSVLRLSSAVPVAR